MNFLLLPLLSAVLQAASLILHKIGLSKKKIALREYVPALFFFLTLYSVGTFPVLGWVDMQAVFTLTNMIYLAVILVCAVLWNYLYYVAIDTEEAHVVQNIMSLSPMVTIFISFLFIPQSFDLRISLAGMVATAVMMWGYWRHHKLDLSQHAVFLFYAVVFMSIETVLIGILLQERSMSPVVLFALRTIVMFVFFSWYYCTNIMNLTKTKLGYISMVAILGVAMMLFKFYSLRDSGIAFTSLVLILVPVMVFIASAVILREKVTYKHLMTIVFVVLSILYALAVQG